ncbi:MAG: hypothetical protein H6737_30925 [Alphaproteobacteria bacterium]|nr:hypothetical protein [Alphaproteobacteria bacterium]
MPTSRDASPVPPRWVRAAVWEPDPLAGTDATEALLAQVETGVRGWLVDNLDAIAGGPLQPTDAMVDALRALVAVDDAEAPVARERIEAALEKPTGAGNLVVRLQAIARRLTELPPLPDALPPTRLHLLVVHSGASCAAGPEGVWIPRSANVTQFFRLAVDHLGPTGWTWGLPAPYRRPTNLRRRVDPLIGRAGLLSRISDAFSGSRWVTLVGPAGIGKSRAALAWATEPRREHAAGAGGVWGVGGEGLAEAVADVLEAPGASVERVGRLLAARGDTLLVLDPADEGVAPTLEAWLAAAPRLRLLVTHRTPLGAPSEAVVPVEPLATDDARRLLALRTPGTALDGGPADAASLAALVDRLGGNPGRIEAAASRRAVRTVREILAELTEPGA